MTARKPPEMDDLPVAVNFNPRALVTEKALEAIRRGWALGENGRRWMLCILPNLIDDLGAGTRYERESVIKNGIVHTALVVYDDGSTDCYRLVQAVLANPHLARYYLCKQADGAYVFMIPVTGWNARGGETAQ